MDDYFQNTQLIDLNAEIRIKEEDYIDIDAEEPRQSVNNHNYNRKNFDTVQANAKMEELD